MNIISETLIVIKVREIKVELTDLPITFSCNVDVSSVPDLSLNSDYRPSHASSFSHEEHLSLDQLDALKIGWQTEHIRTSKCGSLYTITT